MKSRYLEQCLKRVLKFIHLKHIVILEKKNFLKNLIYRGFDKFSIGLPIIKINNDFELYVKKIKPKNIFLYRPRHFYKSTLLRLKKQLGINIIIYNNDSPFSNQYPKYFWRRYLRLIDISDLILSYRQSDIDQYKKIGYHSELFMPWFYPPYYKKNNFKFKERDNKILFVGHSENDIRIEILDSIKNELLLVGPKSDWEKKFVPVSLRNIARLPIWGKDYIDLLSSHKIALCFLSKLNQDVYTRRCFEITASGTLLISEFSKELNLIFGDMYGAVLFKSAKEFQKKLKYLKENPLEVELIANNGKKIVNEKNFDIYSRVNQIQGYLVNQ